MGNGALILVRHFKAPDKACDRKTYTDYVTKTIAQEVTCDELAELCQFFAPCDCTTIVGRIVEKYMGKDPGRKAVRE